MGLDVFVFRYLEIPDDIKTQDELDKFCNEHDISWNFYSENHKNLPKKIRQEDPYRADRLGCHVQEARPEFRGLRGIPFCCWLVI